MTRQDYERIARIIMVVRNLKDQIEDTDHALDVLTRSLATEFAIRNPLFNEDKFFNACGLIEHTQEKGN
jgi:hypothetical protein